MHFYCISVGILHTLLHCIAIAEVGIETQAGLLAISYSQTKSIIEARGQTRFVVSVLGSTVQTVQ